MNHSCRCLVRTSRLQQSRQLSGALQRIVALHQARSISSSASALPSFLSVRDSSTSNNISRLLSCTIQRRTFMATTPEDAGPVERSIRKNLEENFSPLHLEVINDSHLHAHHAAMRAKGGGNGESHFTVEIVSSKFEGKRQVQRHRSVYSALQAELDAGLHALVIKAQTPSEAGMDEANAPQAPPASSGEQASPGP